jgi:RimJ/RimL family protein N-acetyltransferase
MEIGYALYPEWWGRGFATEMARGLVRMGFGELGCRSLVAITRPDNLGSRHVLEKAGLQYEGDIAHGGILLALYRIRHRSTS